LNWRKQSPAEALKQNLARQTEIIHAVQTSQCPSCNGKLRIEAYENSLDLSHYEVAIACVGCRTQMVYDEKGLRGEYAREENRPRSEVVKHE